MEAARRSVEEIMEDILRFCCLWRRFSASLGGALRDSASCVARSSEASENKASLDLKTVSDSGSAFFMKRSCARFLAIFLTRLKRFADTNK